jgi:PKD repeat protein
MTPPSRRVKRLLIPLSLAAGLIVSVQAVIATPAADFTYSVAAAQPASGCKTVNFTNTSTDPDDPDNDVETVDWDLNNDGDFGDASGPTASRVFDTAGTFTVGVRATDTDASLENSTTKSVEVTSAAPTAIVTGPANVQAGQSASFSATGNDGDGEIVSYAWDFDNDGFNDGTGTTASHTYPATALGPQTARVQVRDNCNVTGIGTAAVTVASAPAPPLPSFTMKVGTADVTTVNSGVQVTFASTSTDPNNDALTYSWSLDGDPAVFDDGTGATVTKTYPIFPSVKTIKVRLRVSDGQAGSPVEASADLIINKAPFGAFTITPEVPLIGEAVTFNALPEEPAQASFDFENSITSYEWDFDYSGTPATFVADATGSSASHLFATSGAKRVALRLMDEDGGVTVVPRTVNVQVTRPNVGLIFSPQSPLPGQAVTLTSTSSPSASPGAPSLVSTEWDFDYEPTADFTLDGAGGSIVTSFGAPGPHTVAIKVTETGGGYDVKSATIVVNAPPQASFTVAPTKPLEGREVTFASLSNDPDGPLVKQEWDLDNDGKYERSGTVVSSAKLKKGARTVRLRVTDSKGATAVSTRAVKVGARPLKPPVDIKRSIGFARRNWGIQLVVLLVKVPSKTAVSVDCTGPGCPSGTFRQRSKKKAATLRFDKVRGSLRAGAKITVVTTRKGYISGYDTYLVRGGNRAPLLREQCRMPGKKKPRACP